jgi:hypothetical protein
MSRLARLFAVLALVTGAAGPVTATSPTPASGATWSANQLVEYRWKDAAEPPGWMRSAVNAAASDSNASRAARAAVFTHRDGAGSWIGYTADLPTTYAIGYAVRNVPDSFNIRLRPQGYMLDWGKLRWCQFYDSPPTGCYDAEMITLHEFGHIQTLGHANESDVTDWLDTIMHAAPKTKAKAGWNAHAFGRCDVARLQIRYRPLTPSTRYSTCLSMPTQLSIGASATSVASGANVAFTARLKVADDAVYPKLAGEPLDGRTVILQRRAPGASSWATVATMNAQYDDAGRYVKTVSVSATYDWRAKFATPSAEGLTGSTSSAARVTAGASCPSSGKSMLEPAYETC